ncbi:MAG: hypothetical protein Q9160_001400 [Pyrenula sp. 1 TL-2023]
MASVAGVKRFDISILESQIEDLKRRLSQAKFPTELEDSGWDYGSPLSDVKRLTKFWKDDFDWKAAQAKLNKLPQYRTKPLAFGSPGFEVVAPSLPNYGFSEGSLKPGFGLAQYAETCHKLMLKLGYKQYVTQGGDWGFYITRCISRLYPTHCLATHINMPHGSSPSPLWSPLLFLRTLPSYLSLLLSPSASRASFARTTWFLTQGSGYRALQSTKPQTLAYALDDSPVALLAWILEKLHDWTDGPYPWTDDEICTWIAIYWFSTMGPGAASRIYYEAMNPSPKKVMPGRVTTEMLTGWIPGVKIGVSVFPKELFRLPAGWVRNLGEVVQVREHERGGHFAAWERPEELVEDVRGMFGEGGGAEAVVKGKTW